MRRLACQNCRASRQMSRWPTALTSQGAIRSIGSARAGSLSGLSSSARIARQRALPQEDFWLATTLVVPFLKLA